MWDPESDWAEHWDLNPSHGEAELRISTGLYLLSCILRCPISVTAQNSEVGDCSGPDSSCDSSLQGLKLGLWGEASQRQQLEVEPWVINMFIHHHRIVPPRFQVSFYCVFNSGMLLLSCQQILVRKWVGSYLTEKSTQLPPKPVDVAD